MADIYLDIGVNGGASLTGASGAAIERDITAIVRAIEQNVTTKLEFRADETALNNMVNQIETAFRNANITINTSGLEAQLRAATEAVAGMGVGTSASGSTQAQDIDRVTRSIENLAEGEREAANAARERVNVLREWLVLSQQADRSEDDKRRLKAINGTLGSYTKSYRNADSQYADRYANVNQSSERSALTRRIILEDAERIFTSYGLSNELEYLQNIRDEFGLDAGEIVQEINSESQAISDAIERQGDEVESATDEATQQIEEGTQRLVGAYENRAAALAEVTRRVAELTNGRDAQYELVDIDYRRNNEEITQQSVRLRNRASGNIFTNRYNLDANEDGSFDIRLVSNESNRQVQNYLNGVVDKLDTIRHKRDQIIDDKSTGQLAAGLTKGLDSAIAEVGILEQAVRRAVETGDYSQFQRDTFLGGRYSNVTDIDSAMSAIDRAMEDAQYSMRGFTTEVNKAYKESNNLVATYSKIDSLRSKVNNSENRYSTGEGSTYNQVVKDFEMIDELKAKIDATGKTLATDNFSAGAKNAEKYTSELRELYDLVVKLEYHIQQLERDSNNLSDSYIKSQTDNFRKDYEAFIKSPAAYDVDKDLYNNTQLRQILADINKVNQAIKKGESNWEAWDVPTKKSFSHVHNNINQIIEANSRLSIVNQKLITEERRKNNVLTQTHKTYSEALRYYKEHESGIKKNIELNKKWSKVLSDIHSGRYGDDIGGMRTALSELQTETKDAGAETKTLHAQLKKLFHDHFGSVAATTIIGAITDILRNAYTRVLDIDKAMTELRKVTDLTEESYKRFGDTAARVAREVGGTIADTINATADFARLGFSINEATELAKAAMIYKNVGDGIEDISQASESIISTIKGFGLEASDAMGIIDKFNEVGNKYAIDSVGIGEALKRSAAALSAANNTLDESIALATAANNVIQDPDVVGTALKTMSMFLRAAKTEAEEAGIETEGMANSVSELREEMKQLTGIDIMIDDATFKSTYQILQDISRVWDKLADVDQANIAEMLVGKRQANIFFSLVENFEEAEEVLDTSLSAIGSAAEENEKYLASIEGRIQSLLISFEELSTGILDSDLVKGAIEFLTNIVNLLNVVNDFGGGKGVAILASVAGLSTLFSRSGGFGFETLVDEKGLTYLTLFGEKLTVIGDKAERAQGQIGKINLGGAIKDWANHFFLGRKSFNDINKEVDALQEYANRLQEIANKGGDVSLFVHDSLFSEKSTLKIKDADIATRTFADSLTGLAKDSDALNAKVAEYKEKLVESNKQTSVGITLAKKFGASLANIGVSLLIDAAITGIIALVEWIATAEERAEEARQTLVQAAQDSANELKTVSDELDNIRQKIDNINAGKLEMTDDDTLEKLKEQEASLEAQYAWLLKIDEYNNRAALTETEKKIYQKKTIDEFIVIKEANNMVEDEAFGEYDSFEQASMYMNSIDWYQAKLNELLNGGLTKDEFADYARWSAQLETAQKHLVEITKELNSYVEEGSIRFDDDPHSTYSKITALLEETVERNSLDVFKNEQSDSAASALNDFLIAHGSTLASLEKTTHELPFTQEIITDYYAPFGSSRYVVDPQTGALEDVVTLYTNKTIDYLFEEFLKNNPILELDAVGFSKWKKSFEEYVKNREDEFITFQLSRDSSYLRETTDRAYDLLSPETKIELLEKQKQGQPYSRVREIQKEINELKAGIVQEVVDLSEDLVKADSDYSSQLTTHIENLSTKQNELQSAYDKIVENGSLDLGSDEAKELLKLYPELIKYSDEYTNTLNVPASVLQKYFDEAKNTALNSINLGKQEVEDALSNLEIYGDIEGNKEHKEAHEALLEQRQLLEAQESYIQSWSLATGNIEEFTSAMEKSADLSDKFVTLSEATKSLNAIDINSTQWLTDWEEALTAMKNAYPNNAELEQAIRNYKDNATEENARAVVEIYNDLYQKDIDNYNAWLDAKAGENTWDNFISENTTFVEDFKRLYGIDLLNYASYQEAKAKLFYDWAKAEAGGYEYILSGDLKILKKRFEKEGLEGLLDAVFSTYDSPYSPNVPPGEDDDWFSNQKEKYEKDLQAEEERYNRGIISYEEYLKQRKNLLNLYFPAGQSQEGDEFREEQIKDIDWDNLYLSRMSEWDKQNDYDSNNLQQVIARVKEQRRLAEEMFGKTSSEYYSPTLFAQYITEAAESEKEALTELLNRGVIEYDEFFKRLTEIREQYTDADGKYIIPISFVTEGADPEKQINDFLSKWDEDNGYSEDSQDVDLRRRRAAQWREQIENSDYNNESSALYNPEKVEEMLKEVENYEDNTESMALEQTRNAIQKLRDERERMWDEEQEALDKINEKEQRRLDIVKARIDLENAKKNRNQLVFANGSYYYDYDQEALRNAEEKFSDAVKADEDANREEAKEADLKVYDTIIDALDELEDDSVSAIDAKTLSDALSDYKDDGKISDDNLAEMQKILGEDSELLKEMKDGTLSMDADQIREIVRGMVASDISQSVVSTEEQEKINQAVSEVANNIYDNSITIGNIVNNVTMPEGTTQQQVQTLIDGFASELIDHLHSLSTKIN